MIISVGVRYMLIASVCFATMNVFIKFLPNIPPVEIVFFRSIISFALSYLMLRGQKVNVWGHNKPILFLRGLAGAIALTLFFYTIQKMPLASAITIQHISPIFTAILGIFIVRERVRALQWLFFAIAFGGIVVIQGFDSRVSLGYAFLGLLSALLSGLAYNCVRKLNTTEHPLVIVFYFPLVTLPMAGLYSVFNWVQPIGIEWLYLGAIGILTQIAQFYMTKSYQREEISKVSSVQYLGIIYGLGYGYVFFGETYEMLVFGGMALVLFGVILNVWYKQRLETRS